jgi:1-pyrroline-5-carboxylate dehydrogenase
MSRPGIFRPPPPRNEPVLGYEAGSPERAELQARLADMTGDPIEIPVVVGGEEIRTGDTFDAVMPHDK